MHHVLSEICAEGFEVRFEESNISTHHAEVRNLLSLNPEIDRLRADSKEQSCFANRQRDFVYDSKGGLRAPKARVTGKAPGIHISLYGLL